MSQEIVEQDQWHRLKAYTNARIALGHVGGSLPLKEVLKFNEAYAAAKDAITVKLATESLKSALLPDIHEEDLLELTSQVKDRAEYLKRPDLGGKLSDASKRHLSAASHESDKPLIALILTDGLSAEAVNQQGAIVVNQLIQGLPDYQFKICLATHGRVAIGDQIGEYLKARMTAVLIGERPGLSSPQSMGIYTTYNPRTGLTNEARNCISNIHDEGLSPVAAAIRLKALIKASFSQRISGVTLKLASDFKSMPLKKPENS